MSRLALHYWRPDFTPAQVKLMLQDFLHDLDGYSASIIADACAQYRQDAKNRFYPTPGQLLEILKRWDDRPSLPVYRPVPQIGMTRATKSVAEILRENGYDAAAQSWSRT